MQAVSIIIPVHYGGAAFRRCLAGAVAAASASDEIVVVADGETDGVWREAERQGLRVVHNEQIRGPAAARNRGADAARHDLLFFVDADVVIPPDTLDRLRTVFADDLGVDAVIGSYDDAPGADDFLSQYRNLLHCFTHQTAREEASTFWGACGAIRRSAFSAVSGFDERFRRPCVEDIDLGYRLQQAGYRVRLCKDLQVKHLKRWRFWPMIRTDVCDRALPWASLLLQHARVDADLNLRSENRWSVVAVFALTAALIGAIWSPSLLVAAGAAAGLLMVLNAAFYRFLRQRRGWRFALAAMPLHWLYYLYGGMAFGVALVRHAAGVRIPDGGGIATIEAIR